MRVLTSDIKDFIDLFAVSPSCDSIVGHTAIYFHCRQFLCVYFEDSTDAIVNNFCCRRRNATEKFSFLFFSAI